MRLHELLAIVDEGPLRDLAGRCIAGSGTESISTLRSEIETRLRQPDYVEATVFARRPPALAVLVELLAAPGFRRPVAELTERAIHRAQQWREAVTSGALLAQDEKRDLYRKILRAAWSNDLRIDTSEASLLGLLRRELGLTRTEHFLVGFHDSIAHLWDGAEEATDLVRTLRNHGIVWSVGDDVALAEEMEAPIRRSTGIELDEQPYLRLLDRLNGTVIREVLGNLGLARSGSKADLAQRVVYNFVTPSTLLDSGELGRADLADLARAVGVSTAGRKDEIVSRIIACFRTNNDLTANTPVESVPLPIEPKVLDEAAFSVLFRPLSNNELHALMGRLELPLSGAKEAKIGTLWASRFCEASLLLALRGEVIRRLCEEHGVSRSGTRSEQAERLVEHVRPRV